MNKELSKTLTTALVQWIDGERPEGTMCCSSYECEKLEKAFEGGCYDVVQEFINTKLTRLTAFEKTLAEFVNDVLAKEPQNPLIWTMGSGWADKLLAHAKKELLSYADERNPKIEAMADLERTFDSNPEKLPQWLKDKLAKKHLEGYIKGQEDAEKRYNESVAYHYDDDLGKKHLEGYIKGRADALREMSDFMESHFNTQSGTSTLKAEGNTSVTDGKPHNPSFTD